jgi:hypothetical protein
MMRAPVPEKVASRRPTASDIAAPVARRGLLSFLTGRGSRCSSSRIVSSVNSTYVERRKKKRVNPGQVLLQRSRRKEKKKSFPEEAGWWRWWLPR